MGRKFASEKERKTHQEAVKLRKMTDEQLTGYVNDLYVRGFNEGLIYKTKEFEKVIKTTKGIGPKLQEKILFNLEG